MAIQRVCNVNYIPPAPCHSGADRAGCHSAAEQARRDLCNVLSKEIGFLTATTHGYMAEVIRLSHMEKQALLELDLILSSMNISMFLSLFQTLTASASPGMVFNTVKVFTTLSIYRLQILTLCTCTIIAESSIEFFNISYWFGRMIFISLVPRLLPSILLHAVELALVHLGTRLEQIIMGPPLKLFTAVFRLAVCQLEPCTISSCTTVPKLDSWHPCSRTAATQVNKDEDCHLQNFRWIEQWYSALKRAKN